MNDNKLTKNELQNETAVVGRGDHLPEVQYVQAEDKLLMF